MPPPSVKRPFLRVNPDRRHVLLSPPLNVTTEPEPPPSIMVAATTAGFSGTVERRVMFLPLNWMRSKYVPWVQNK